MEDDELPNNINEFDMNFCWNNPGIIKSQKYYRENFERVKQICSYEDDYFCKSQEFFVNLAYNNQIRRQKPVLNTGKLKTKDFENFHLGQNLPDFEGTPQTNFVRMKQFISMEERQILNETQIEGVIRRIEEAGHEIDTKVQRMKNFPIESELHRNDMPWRAQSQQQQSLRISKRWPSNSSESQVEEQQQKLKEIQDKKFQLIKNIKSIIENAKISDENVKEIKANGIHIFKQLEKLDLKYPMKRIRILSHQDQAQIQEMITLYNHIDSVFGPKSISLNNHSSISSQQCEIPEYDQFLRRFASARISNNNSSKKGGSSGDSILSWKSKLSMNRKLRLEALQLDYFNYLKFFQNNFVTRCQMMNIEYSKTKIDILQLMKKTPEYKKYNMSKLAVRQKTIVIDVENTLVTKLDIKNLEEIEQIKLLENFDKDYILIEERIDELPLVYTLRPYTFDMLRALQPFYELIAFSNIPERILNIIIKHIEAVLFQPAQEFNFQKRDPELSEMLIGRIQVLPESVPFFNYVLHQDYFVFIEAYGLAVENLLFLMQYRLKENIILFSSNPKRIVVAMREGFSVLPVISFERFYRDDYQLNLIENYLLRMRHRKDLVQDVKMDFQFLVQQVHKQSSFKPQASVEEEEKVHSPRFKQKSPKESCLSGSLKSQDDSEDEDEDEDYEDQRPRRRCIEAQPNRKKFTPQRGIRLENDRVVYDAKLVILVEGTIYNSSQISKRSITQRDNFQEPGNRRKQL